MKNNRLFSRYIPCVFALFGFVSATAMIPNNQQEVRLKKVVVVGNTDTQKTALVRQLVETSGSSYAQHLFQSIPYSSNGKNITMQILDTAGQEQYRSVLKGPLRSADAAVILVNWLEGTEKMKADALLLDECIMEYAGNNVIVFLVMDNMDDSVAMDDNNLEDIHIFAKENHLHLLGVNTKARTGITGLLKTVGNHLCSLPSKVSSDGVKLTDPTEKKRPCCS
jgi:small GTP-binding protein